jgi:hypothetical protein
MSTERQTINIPSTKDQPFTEPYYFIDNRSKTALRELQQGDLLQIVRQICPSKNKAYKPPDNRPYRRGDRVRRLEQRSRA